MGDISAYKLYDVYLLVKEALDDAYLALAQVGGKAAKPVIFDHVTADYAAGNVAWPTAAGKVFNTVYCDTTAGNTANSQILPPTSTLVDGQIANLKVFSQGGTFSYVGNTGQATENPAVPGQYSAPAAGWTLAPGTGVTLQWRSTKSTWFVI